MNTDALAPRCHPRLQIDPPLDGRRIVRHAGTRRYFRIGQREAELLQSLDGRTDAASLRCSGRNGFTPEQVDQMLAWFGAQGLLDDGSAEAAQVPRGAWQRVADFLGGPDRWRLHLVDPDAWLDRHRAAIDRLFSPVALGCYLLLLLAPLLVPMSQADLLRLAPEHFSAMEWVLMYAAMLLIVALHELAHAVTCKHFGGRVHRIGLMLLYLQPVMYCDVSDSWRFQERDHKIAVALAGCFAQALISALLVLAWGLAHVDALLMLALVNVAVALVNLLPFVRLDGYWVAVHLFDEPQLRAKAFGAVLALARGRAAPLRQPALLAFGIVSVLATAGFWLLGLHLVVGWVSRLWPELAPGVAGALAATAALRLHSFWQDRRKAAAAPAPVAGQTRSRAA